MPCPDSGTISIQSLVDEFGGNAPHSMNEYYRDGAYVPGNNTSIPTSGAISLSNCYSAVNEIQHVISSNVDHVHASNTFGSNWSSTVPKRIVVNSGVTVGASSTHALYIPAGMGGTLVIDNSGNIHGYGGARNGGSGGHAIYCEQSSGVTVNNSGQIKAGGGGGGAGGSGGTGGSGGSGGTGGTGSYSQSYGQSNTFNSWTYRNVTGPCSSVSWGYSFWTACMGRWDMCQRTHGGDCSRWDCGGNTNAQHCWGCSACREDSDDGNDWGWCQACNYTQYQGGAGGGNGGSGGGGGAGGYGGKGQGDNWSAESGGGGSAGASGNGGSGGGNNGSGSGTGGTGGTGGQGGTGGTGGAGGSFGNSGASGNTGATGSQGATGNTGANGNHGNGSGGSSGSSGSGGSGGSGGGSAGYYIYNRSYVTLNNTGSVAGQ